MADYYEILGVKSLASKAEIKAAFKKLALKFHPDKNQGNKQAEEQFKKINEAYQTLSDDNKRFFYNQKYQSSTGSATSSTFSTDAYSTSYNKYRWEAPNTAASDYSNQGRHYSEPAEKKEKDSIHYIIGITLFIVIGSGALLFGFMMNRIAAKEHYKTAIVRYETENYTAAIMELNKAVEFNQDFTEAYLLRADILVKLEKYDRALIDYNMAIRLSKDADESLLKKRDYCRKVLSTDLGN